MSSVPLLLRKSGQGIGKRRGTTSSPIVNPNEVRYFIPLKRRTNAKTDEHKPEIKAWYCSGFFNLVRFNGLSRDDKMIALTIVDPWLTDMIR